MRTEANIRRPGNPTWCRPKLLLRERPTNLEMFAEEHGIPEADWPNSQLIRGWVARHKRSHYVPEELLRRFEMKAEEDSW